MLSVVTRGEPFPEEILTNYAQWQTDGKRDRKYPKGSQLSIVVSATPDAAQGACVERRAEHRRSDEPDPTHPCELFAQCCDDHDMSRRQRQRRGIGGPPQISSASTRCKAGMVGLVVDCTPETQGCTPLSSEGLWLRGTP